MGILSDPLFSPEINTDHPVTITAILNAGDLRQMKISEVRHFDGVTNMEPGSLRGDTTKTGVSSGESALAYDICWRQVRDAVSYRLYGSMSPTGHGILLQKDIELTETIWHVPYFSSSVVFFFWVSAIDDAGTEIFLSELPASLMASQAMKNFGWNTITADDDLLPGVQGLDAMMLQSLEFIRAANRLQIELGSEPALLYLRRYAEDRPWGGACSCTDQRNRDDSDPDYIAKGNCKLCFGIGIFGGFLPAIPILVRYGDAPEETWKWTKRGQEKISTFNTKMLWAPICRTGDLVVRQNGQRYLVGKTQPDISARAVRLHQEFDLEMISDTTSVLMEVTNAAIENGLRYSKLPRFARDGYRIFG